MRKLHLIVACLSIMAYVNAQPQINIPDFSIPNPQKTYVIAIGNEDYQSYSDKYTENVMFAIMEAEKFTQMMMHMYNVPKFNVSFYPDAISTKIKNGINKVSVLASKAGPDAQIIIYYTGRFESDQYGIKNYLIPTDQAQASINQGIDLEYIYQKLAQAQTKNIWVLIDACKSGKQRQVSLLEDGGEPLKIYQPEYENKIKVLVASSEPKVKYDQVTDVPQGQQPKNNTSVVDNKPPKILLTSPDYNGNLISLDERNILIQGKVTDETGVYAIAVNGKECSLDPSGNFQARVPLAIGENKVLIEAIDVKDNLAQISFEVTRKETQEVVDNTLRPDGSVIKGKNYALIVGINDYEDPIINDLSEPVNDAQKLYNVLTQQYLFDADDVRILKNPTREEMIAAMDYFEQNITPDDNLIVFYAGHGYWDDRVKKGYWFPSDASHENTANWLRNSTITGYISGINSRHTLVIADACFSGSIFHTRGSFEETPPPMKELYALPSRKAMTSGNFEEVPDKSIFLENLTNTLTNNQEKYISAEKLFLTVKPEVTSRSTTIPQYGDIKNTGDEGGVFIFIRR
ncbi:MAG: caspase family protein [Bacteroidales bacterium]|nr:caspase family protein [Bacteroidales bacterium]